MNHARRQPSKKIVVLADDLSGAAEMAGIAVAHGLSAEVQRHEFVPVGTQCIVVDTDSRLLPADAAAQKVRALTQAIVGSTTAPPLFFKKIDSVLRGPVLFEIEAMMAALNVPRTLVMPANPSRGRTIHEGRYYIAGVPLDQTVFADDPEFPRHTAEVIKLLGDEGITQIRLVPVGGDFDFDGIALPDMLSVDDVRHFARKLPRDTLAIGAADFFSAILRERFGLARDEKVPATFNVLPAPRLLVCGSQAAWQTRREQCRRANIETQTQHAALATPHPRMALGIEVESTKVSPGVLLRQLADAAARVIQQCEPRTLLLEGGATAAAIAERLGWRKFCVSGTTADGLALLRPLNGEHECAILIKPGSYPWPDEVWRQFCA